MTSYQNDGWRAKRKRFLIDHPYCAVCDQPATEVDHIMPRAQLVAEGFNDPDAPHLLQPLCKRCHSAKTVREDGGFGRQARPIQER